MNAQHRQRYYQVLDLPNDASPQDIRTAYRKLVKTWHPDLFIHDRELQAQATVIMQRISVAYRMLTTTDLSGDAPSNDHDDLQVHQGRREQKSKTGRFPSHPARSRVAPPPSMRPHHSLIDMPAPPEWIEHTTHMLVLIVILIVMLLFLFPDTVGELGAVIDYMGTDGGLAD